MTAALDRARAAWGAGLPAWVEALAVEADATNQARAARRIGYSAAAISQTLSATYKGDLTAVQRAVEGALMAATVNCPILGTLGTDVCQQHQKAGFSSGNPLRIQLYSACRNGCPHSRLSPPTGASDAPKEVA
jgi:hypothetical protein